MVTVTCGRPVIICVKHTKIFPRIAKAVQWKQLDRKFGRFCDFQSKCGKFAGWREGERGIKIKALGEVGCTHIVAGNTNTSIQTYKTHSITPWDWQQWVCNSDCRNFGDKERSLQRWGKGRSLWRWRAAMHRLENWPLTSPPGGSGATHPSTCPLSIHFPISLQFWSSWIWWLWWSQWIWWWW